MSRRLKTTSKLGRNYSVKKIDCLRVCQVCYENVEGSDLREHMKTHAGKITHRCPYCFELVHSKDMPNHMRSHKGEKPYKCVECNISYKNKSLLKTHKKQVHNWTENDSVVSGELQKDNNQQPPQNSNNSSNHLITQHQNLESLEVHNSNDSTDGSDASTSSQIVQTCYYCQFCFTTYFSKDDYDAHKCISSFNRADCVGDHQIENQAQVPTEMNIQIAQVPTEMNIQIAQLSCNAPENETPEAVFCPFCSTWIFANQVSEHMALHGLITAYS